MMESSRRSSSLTASNASQIAHKKRFTWAELLERVFAVDVLRCPRCGSRRRMIAMITDPATIQRILSHLRLPTKPLPIAPARPPPQAQFGW